MEAGNTPTSVNTVGDGRRSQRETGNAHDSDCLLHIHYRQGVAMKRRDLLTSSMALVFLGHMPSLRAQDKKTFKPEELDQMLERPVHLFLHVKVSERWAEDPSHYRTIGLDYEPKS